MFFKGLWSSISRQRASRKSSRRSRGRRFLSIYGSSDRALLVESLEPRAMLAPVITATLTDNNTTGISPGELIQYTEIISNTAAIDSSGANDALNVQIAQMLDPNTTLVAGSLNISPVAFDDTFSAVGNTQLFVNATGTNPGSTPAAATVGNILSNDVEFMNDLGVLDTFTLATSGTISTSGGGSVTLAADGTFSYTPASGFTGADTFIYTITDDGVNSVNALTGTGTVTINVANKVWYVNNGAGPGGDGRSHMPFASLASVSGAMGPDATGDILFVHRGSGNYDGGLTLLNNQTLWGQGEALVVGGFDLFAAGTDPTLVNTGAGGHGVTLASGNTLKGFTVGNTNGYDISNTVTATVGQLTVSNVNLIGTGGLFRADSGGALSVNLDTATTSSTGAGIHGIHLGGALTGSFTATAGAISGVNSTGTDVLINGGTEAVSIGSSITSSVGGSIDIGNHGTNDIRFVGALNITGGTGISVHNNTGGIIAFTNASKVISTGANNAIDLDSNAGVTVNFTGGGLVITTTTGAGLEATGGGTISVTGAGNTITSGAGTALNVANTAIGSSELTFQSINTTTASANSAIVLNTTGTSGGLNVTGNGVSGTSGEGAGGTIANKTVDAIALNSTARVRLNDMIIGANAATAGEGQPTVTNNITGDGIQLTTVTPTSGFNYGLTLDNVTISRTGGDGINGTGGGNVGLLIRDSRFLNNGDDLVTVTESAIRFGSGFPSADKITGNVHITDSTFAGFTGYGFTVENSGNGTLDMTVEDCVFKNNDGTTVGNSGIQVIVDGSTTANNPKLNLLVEDTTFTNLDVDGIEVTTDPGGTSNVTIRRTTYSNPNGDNAIHMVSGSADADDVEVMNVLIEDTTITSQRGTLIFLKAGAGTYNATLTSTAGFTGKLDSGVNADGGGAHIGRGIEVLFDADNAEAIDAKVLIEGQTLRNIGVDGIQVTNFETLAATTIDVAIAKNVIGEVGAETGRQGTGEGIEVRSRTAGTMNLSAESNTIRMRNPAAANTGMEGIDLDAEDATTLNATIVGNNFNNPVNTGPNLVATSETAGATLNIDVRTNTSTAGPNPDYILTNTAGTFRVKGAGTGAVSAANIQAAQSSGAAQVNGTVNFNNNADIPTPAAPTTPTLPPTPPASLIFVPTIEPPGAVAMGGGSGQTPVVDPPIASVPADDGVVSQGELTLLVSAAIARWEVTGLSSGQSELLRSVVFTVADLGGRSLGRATPGHITLDDNGAANGWFVDSTPLEDSEFVLGGTGVLASAASTGHGQDARATQRVDALTTVMHELGHQLGLDDTYAYAGRNDLMYGFLALGTRRLPATGQAEGAVPGGDESPDYVFSPITIGTLPAQKSVTIRFDATVNSPAAAGAETITLQGTVSGSNFSNILTDDPDVASQQATITTLDASPDLSLTNDNGVTAVAPGDTLIYTLNYSNLATATQHASGVQIAMKLPDGASFVAAENAGWSLDAGTLTFNIGPLNVGAGSFATLTLHVVDPAAAGQESIVSTATISDDGTSGADFSAANNTAVDTDTLNAQPDLRIRTKSDGVTAAAPGDTLTYTIDYDNHGNQDATGVSITDSLPEGTSFIAAENVGWLLNSGTLRFTIGNLNGGADGSATLVLHVVSPAPAGLDSIVNTATIDDDHANGADPTADNSQTDTDSLSAAPDLRISSKTDAVMAAVPGDTLLYTIDYDNHGNQNAAGVVITDPLPAGTSFIAAENAGWLQNGDTLTLSIGNLNAGASGIAMLTLHVVSPAPAGVANIVNTATIDDDHANGADPTADNSQTDADTLNAQPDLRVKSKTDGVTTAAPGETLTYTIEFENHGNQNATGVVVADVLPPGTSFVAAENVGWLQNGNTLTFVVGHLNTAGSGTATLKLHVVSSAPAGQTTIVNTATIDDDHANGIDPTADNSQTDTDTLDAVPDLQITSFGDGVASAAPGDTLTYTLAYANAGNQDSTGVFLTQTLPAGTTIDSASTTSGWTQQGMTSTYKLDIGNVAGGATGSKTFFVNVTNPAPAGLESLLSDAAIDDDHANGADPTAANNLASDTDTLNASANLAITKSDGDNPGITPGENVTYALSFSNIGNQDASGVVLHETVPAGTTFDAVQSSVGWVLVTAGAGGPLSPGSTYRFNVAGTLAGSGGTGGPVNFAVTADNPFTAGNQISNTATIDYAVAEDSDPTNNVSSDTTPVADAVSVDTAAAGDETADEAGDKGLFTFTRSITTASLTADFELGNTSTAGAADFSLAVLGSGSMTFDAGMGTGTVTFPAGIDTVTIELTAIAEAEQVAEAAQTVTLVVVAQPDIYIVGEPSDATVNIAQNGFVVINTSDAGEGSLRQALLNANAIAGTDTITFGGSVFTDVSPDVITLASGELLIASDLTIQGPGANLLKVSGNNASRVLREASGSTATLFGLTIADGNGAGGVSNNSGGGVFNEGTLTLRNVVVSGNSATVLSGGIANVFGALTLINSSVVNNSSSGPAGGIDSTGIPNTLIVISSTIANNNSGQEGGAIRLVDGTAIITNSTISGNSAALFGGGIANIFTLAGTLSISNSTITGNRGASSAGGILASGAETLSNSIVAGNVKGASPSTTPSDIEGGTIDTANNNLVGDVGTAGGISHDADGDPAGGNNNIVGVNGSGTINIATVLGLLADNGGPTQTHSLVADSPALNSGSNALISADAFDLDGDADTAEPAAFDQRGSPFQRVLETTVDMGALEGPAFPWHNFAEPFDVRGGSSIAPDGNIDAGDALAIINYINAFESGPVPDDAAIGQPFGFLDTTKDNNVAPDDALSVINAINADLGGEGESSVVRKVSSHSALPNGQVIRPNGELSSIDLIELLSLDVASQSKRRR